MNKLRNELFKKGYVKISKLIHKDILNEINKLTTDLVNNQSDEDKKKQISTGSMINVTISEKFINLIANKKLIKKFEEMGYANPKWSSGYIIGKSPNSAPLYWHTDWWAWDDPISFETKPTMLFVMFYLTNTNKKNGCLRVIPGSHLKYNKVHQHIKKHHSHYRLYNDPNDPVFKSVDDEEDIPSELGDIIIGDGRILHAAHPNLSNEMRTVVTLWYYPDFDQLPDYIKASSKEHHKWPKNWSNNSMSILKQFFPKYEGNAKKIKWNRIRSS